MGPQAEAIIDGALTASVAVASVAAPPPSPPPPLAVPPEDRDTQPDWPRPAATAWACLEVGAGWLLLLLAGLASLVALLHALQSHEAQAMRDARLAITLHDIARRLEADLALGYALADNARAQTLLEDALGQDGSLVAAEVFDAAGVSLFNTDRGSIGEQVPPAWLQAAKAYQARRHKGPAWVARTAGERTLGAPLRGPFGEVAGHVSLSSLPGSRGAPAGFVAGAVLLPLLLAAIAARALRRALHSSLAAVDAAPMEQAAARLAATQQRLDATLVALSTADGERA